MKDKHQQLLKCIIDKKKGQRILNGKLIIKEKLSSQQVINAVVGFSELSKI